jgi:hypothetical protein
MNPDYLRGETWGFPGASVGHVETHAAHVFLAGDRAFKIKKPVKLPYLDFSTRDRRQSVLARELEINRTFAPDLYLGLMEVEGEPVLVMRRFEERNVVGQIAEHGEITDELALALAAMAADSHVRAPVADAAGTPIMAGLGRQLHAAFAAAPAIFDATAAAHFDSKYKGLLERLQALLERRAATGLVRRCHGDMHCGNIVVVEGRPVPFDAIEFDEKIATIDVLYDLAFLLMDLLRRGQHRAANLVLNRYLNLRRPQEDLSGLAALPLFLATRAGVRALVTADRIAGLPEAETHGGRAEAMGYFRAALAYLSPPPPRLVCIGGLSGTGKSTLGRMLAPELGAAPGALHIRSDIERKVLAGIGETERLAASHYTAEASTRVYKAMFERAARALAAGHSAVADAVFADMGERSAAEDLARRLGVAFDGFWLEAPREILKSRVAARRGDASDATVEVVERQLGYEIGAMKWQWISASGNVEDALAAIRRKLQPLPGAPA